MNACVEWRERLLDAALGMPTAPDLQAHLSACNGCSRALLDLRLEAKEMDQGLRTLSSGAEPRPGFHTRLWALIEASHGGRMRWLVPTAVTAVLVIAVFGKTLAHLAERWATTPESSVASVSRLAEWRSPTESLLRPPGDELLRSSPDLGEFYFPVNSPHPKPTAEEEKKKGRNQ